MKDYLVRIVRHGEIIIKADNAEEAASIAARFGSTAWYTLDLHVEVARNVLTQNGKYDKSIKDAKVKDGKKHRAKTRKSFCITEDEIPF